MIIRVSLKDPDGFSDSVDQAVRDDVEKLGLDKDETEALEETRRVKAWEKLARFVSYQEYVTIEFDTDAGTATVVQK